MREINDDPERVEEDAQRLREQFGDCSEVYAKTREEAAKIAGDDRSAEYWDKVEETLDRMDDQ